jgi:hypothetical protein
VKKNPFERPGRLRHDPAWYQSNRRFYLNGYVCGIETADGTTYMLEKRRGPAHPSYSITFKTLSKVLAAARGLNPGPDSRVFYRGEMLEAYRDWNLPVWEDTMSERIYL